MNRQYLFIGLGIASLIVVVFLILALTDTMNLGTKIKQQQAMIEENLKSSVQPYNDTAAQLLQDCKDRQNFDRAKGIEVRKCD